ncbi:Transcriptional effector ccr4-related protein, partial [Globisporangium splendens]
MPALGSSTIAKSASCTKKRCFFFENLRSILSFAILGTSISNLVVGIPLFIARRIGLSVRLSIAECLIFGALISTTELDVDLTLFYVVFEESVLNDAGSIVLFTTFSKFIGYTCSRIFHSLVHSLTSGYHVDLIICTVLFCFLGRAAHVYPISRFLNKRLAEPLSMNQQHVLWFSGLRGAVACALVSSFPGEHREVRSSSPRFIAFCSYGLSLISSDLCLDMHLGHCGDDDGDRTADGVLHGRRHDLDVRAAADRARQECASHGPHEATAVRRDTIVIAWGSHLERVKSPSVKAAPVTCHPCADDDAAPLKLRAQWEGGKHTQHPQKMLELVRRRAVPRTLSLMTFNVLAPCYFRHGGRVESDDRTAFLSRAQALIHAIQRERCDLVCLQEYWFNREYQATFRRAFYLSHYIHTLKRPGDKEDGLAIFVEKNKYEIHHVQHIDFEADQAGDRVALLMHVATKWNRHDVPLAQRMYKDMRLDQIKVVLESVRDYVTRESLENVPVLMCGDFNDFNDPVHSLVMKSGYASVFAHLHGREAKITHCNHNNREVGVDFIFASHVQGRNSRPSSNSSVLTTRRRASELVVESPDPKGTGRSTMRAVIEEEEEVKAVDPREASSSLTDTSLQLVPRTCHLSPRNLTDETRLKRPRFGHDWRKVQPPLQHDDNTENDEDQQQLYDEDALVDYWCMVSDHRPLVAMFDVLSPSPTASRLILPYSNESKIKSEKKGDKGGSLVAPDDSEWRDIWIQSVPVGRDIAERVQQLALCGFGICERRGDVLLLPDAERSSQQHTEQLLSHCASDRDVSTATRARHRQRYKSSTSLSLPRSSHEQRLQVVECVTKPPFAEMAMNQEQHPERGHFLLDDKRLLQVVHLFERHQEHTPSKLHSGKPPGHRAEWDRRERRGNGLCVRKPDPECVPLHTQMLVTYTLDQHRERCEVNAFPAKHQLRGDLTLHALPACRLHSAVILVEAAVPHARNLRSFS